MVKILIHIVELFHIRERLKRKNIVHIKRMLWQLQMTVLQHLSTIENIMHQNILRLMQMSHPLPAKHLIDRKGILKPHQLLVLRTDLIIDKICQQHVHTAGLLELLHLCHNAYQRLCIYPVVTVYDLVIASCRVAQSGIDCLTMTAVFLMYRPDDLRIAGCVSVCDLRRAILCGTVIHDEYLQLLSCRKHRLDTFFHICLRVIARNCNRKNFHFCLPFLFVSFHRPAPIRFLFTRRLLLCAPEAGDAYCSAHLKVGCLSAFKLLLSKQYIQ